MDELRHKVARKQLAKLQQRLMTLKRNYGKTLREITRARIDDLIDALVWELDEIDTGIVQGLSPKELD